MRIRNRDPPPKHVFQRGDHGAIRMGATGRLSKLLRVAKQEHLRRRRGRSHGIRECHLARLIYEQRIQGAVKWFTREEPRRPGDQVLATV